MKLIKLLPGLVIVALILSGCGGGGNPGGNSTPSKIVITPGSPLVFYEGTQKFTAVLTDTTGNVIPASFTWSVEPGTSSGSITTDGLFTAGQTPGQCAVVCTASGITARVNVNITGMLNDAGMQLVADTGRVWGNLDAVNRVTSLAESISPETVPASAQKFIDDVSKHAFLSFNFFGVMVRQLPDTYDFDVLNGSKPDVNIKPDQIGSWTITFSDGWKTIFTRTQDLNNQAQFNFTATAADSKTQFHGNFSFLVTELTPSSDPKDGEFDQMAMSAECYQDTNADPSITSASFHGLVDASGYWKVESGRSTLIFEHFVLDGDVDFKFNDSGFFIFSGDWSSDMAAGTQYLVGTIEIPALTITGRIDTTFLQNPTGDLIPNSFKLSNASIIVRKPSSISPEALTLSGSMDIVINNAADFDPHVELTEQNYPRGSFDFKGSIATGQNQVTGSLHLERTAYKAAAFTIGYTLNNAGVSRNFSFGATTTDGRTFQFSLNSDWGPAAIEAQLEFAAQGGLDKITNGVVKANNNQVGTLSLDSTGLLRVDYTNGQYETF